MFEEVRYGEGEAVLAGAGELEAHEVQAGGARVEVALAYADRCARDLLEQRRQPLLQR